MSDILQDILDAKKRTVEKIRQKVPLNKLISDSKKANHAASFIGSVCVPNQLSVIAEMKKRSPSAGTILEDYSPTRIAKIYEEGGARGISVLTEENYFHGSPEHLKSVGKASRLPLLRKDFIFDPYQIYESKLLGASCLLLIVAILSGQSFSELIKLTHNLKMEALVEVHSEYDLEVALKEKPKLIGINNRNLRDLSVNVQTTFNLVKQIPKEVHVISESGIQSPSTIKELKSARVSAVLIGEAILRSKDMSKKLKSFVQAGRN